MLRTVRLVFVVAAGGMLATATAAPGVMAAPQIGLMALAMATCGLAVLGSRV